jgi:hypothetical protein
MIFSVTSTFSLDLNNVSKDANKLETNKTKFASFQDTEYTKNWYFNELKKNKDEIVKYAVLSNNDIYQPDRNFTRNFMVYKDGNEYQIGYTKATWLLLNNFYGVKKDKCIRTMTSLEIIRDVSQAIESYYFAKYLRSEKGITPLSGETVDLNKSYNDLVQAYSKCKEHISKCATSNPDQVFVFLDDYNKVSEDLYKDVMKTSKTIITKEQNMKDEAKRQKAAANKKKIEEKKEYIAGIKSGKLPIKTLKDAKIYYDATDGSSIVKHPPLNADTKYYFVNGRLNSQEGKYYLVQYNYFGGPGYFLFETSNKIATSKFRIGKEITVLGKFTDVREYQTVIGSKSYAPVFTAKYIDH